MKRTSKLLILSALSGIAAPGAFAAFDTLAIFGNAAGTTPPASFTGNGTGTTTITAGGADFWGTADAGVFLYDSTGTNTTTGDFTATVRHVSTTTPAPEWGRDAIMIRATAAAPTAGDALWMAVRKSNGGFGTGRRPTAGANTFRATDIDNAAVNYNSDDNERLIGTGNVANTAVFISAAREGNRLHSGIAADLGGGVAGRWVEQWSTANATAISGLQGGARVIVGLAHQSHPQTISPDTNDINIATFDNWNYAGSYNPARFGVAAGAGANPWSIGGALTVNPNTGAVSGRSYTQVGGVATGEATKWTFSAGRNFVANYGAAGAVKRAVASEVADLVPAANFRRTAALTGLTADLYVGSANPGTLVGVRAIINAATPPTGTAIIPNVNWTGGGDGDANYNGLTGPASFARATQAGNPDPASGAAGAFSGNEENYGVHMQGQIFIDSDANRKGHFADVVLFRDGIDDYTYLNIDGQELLNDNDWSGYNGLDNGGSHVSAMNVSDPKFNDGEWVNFEMIMWEGGGGDNGSLYTDMYDTNNSFIGMAPGAYATSVSGTGSAQIGTQAADASFGLTLPPGQWDVTLTVENTGTSAVFRQNLTVVPEPTAPLFLGLTALGTFLRRRRKS